MKNKITYPVMFSLCIMLSLLIEHYQPSEKQVLIASYVVCSIVTTKCGYGKFIWY